MMIVDNKFNTGDFCYLITDPDQQKRIVTAITVRVNHIAYELSMGTTTSWHIESEISAKKELILS